MDIQQYIAADKEILLNLNGSQSLFWDGFMWVATSTIVCLLASFADVAGINGNSPSSLFTKEALGK